MKKELFGKVLCGLAIIALGVLIAFYGPAEVLNLYFGIVACSVGGAFVIYGIFLLSKRESVPSFAFISGGALIAIGVGFLAGRIDTSVFVSLIVFAVLGIGAGVTLYGIYLLGQKINFVSIIHLAGGIATLTFAILYLAIDKFAKVFWIVIGILIALYGLISIVMLFIPKKEKAVEAKEQKAKKEKKEKGKKEEKSSEEEKVEEVEVIEEPLEEKPEEEPQVEEPNNEEEGE